MSGSTEFKVGLTVIVALVVLVGGIMWGTRYQPAGNGLVLTARFASAYGLDADDPVAVSGVRLGGVETVELQGDGSVLVRFRLNRHLPIPADSRVFIKGMGLMGEKIIAIELGSAADVIDPELIIAGTIESGMGEMFSGAGALIAKTDRILSSLDRLLGDEKTEASIRTSILTIEKTVRSVSGLINANRKDLAAAVTDFRESSAALRNIVGPRQDELGRTLDNFAKSSGQLQATLIHLEDLSVSMKAITGKVESGESSLGRLVNNKELYEKLVKSIDNLDSLVKDVKANPGKYTKGIKFEVF